MPNCYYTCNLLPLDLVARSGHSPRWLGNHLRDQNSQVRRDALGVHPMTCPFVTKLVAAAEEVLNAPTAAGSKGRVSGSHDGSEGGPVSPVDCLVVPGGCDAMRRLGDLLAATYPDRVFVFYLPRATGAAVTGALAADLARLEEWLQGRRPAAMEGGAATDHPGVEASAAVQVEPPVLDYPSSPRPGGVFLVSGPLSDDSLLRLIDKLGSHVSGLESCTSPDRWRPLAGGATQNASTTFVDSPPSPRGDDHLALAARVLETGMCPRRSAVERRTYLEGRLDETQPTSIIYARQSFCDPGAYDALLVAELARERGLPYLEIEVDFPFDANGPLRTRVEAFLEAQLLDDDLLDGDDLFGED